MVTVRLEEPLEATETATAGDVTGLETGADTTGRRPRGATNRRHGGEHGDGAGVLLQRL